MSAVATKTAIPKKIVNILQIGTFLEYFDLMIYVHMAVLLNDLFFPKTDFRVVNFSGRQRYQSQELTKLCLLKRDALDVNTYEDIKILSKMKNIIKINVETADLFNDLINYIQYLP